MEERGKKEKKVLEMVRARDYKDGMTGSSPGLCSFFPFEPVPPTHRSFSLVLIRPFPNPGSPFSLIYQRRPT